MFRTLLLLTALALPAPSAAAFGNQTIGFVLGQNTAATERLPYYRSTSPIAVRVGGDVRGFDTVSVTAHGPGGAAIRAPLARVAGGFNGDLQLATPGTWQLAVTTRLGDVSTKMVSVPLDVVSTDGTDLAAGAMFVLALFFVAAGALTIVHARNVRAPGVTTRS